MTTHNSYIHTPINDTGIIVVLGWTIDRILSDYMKLMSLEYAIISINT